MKGEFYIGLLTLLLLLAGCDKVDAGRGENDGEAWPVSFMLAGVTPTRADGATGVADGTELTIAAYDPNSHNLVAVRNYKVASGSLTLDETDSEAMYLSVGTYDFCAMTPRQVLTGTGKDGKHGHIQQGVDALGAVTRAQVEAAATTAIQLNNLDHLASQIRFTVQVVPQKVDSIASFAVRSIGIDGMVLAAEGEENYLLPDNKLVIPAADAAGKFGTLTIGGTDAFTIESQVDKGPGYINTQKTPLVVFPKAESTFKAVITVAVKKKLKQEDGTIADGEEETITLNAKINRLAFDPGKRYNFEVNYGWDYVRFDITVAPWTTVTDNSTTGSGEQTVSHTIKINQWDDDIDLDMTI